MSILQPKIIKHESNKILMNNSNQSYLCKDFIMKETQRYEEILNWLFFKIVLTLKPGISGQIYILQ